MTAIVYGVKTQICPDHQVRSQDFVAENSKKEPVYRCTGLRTLLNGWSMPHYFTVTSEKPKPSRRPRGSAA